MRFTDVFIKRPVLAVSISFLIVLLGLQAIFKMQVREYPEMTNTVITVSTGYYGASADLIQGFITQPLEQAVAQADNIDFMTSQSVLGRSTITVTMKLNTDPNAALSDVLAKTNSVRSQLPKEAEDPTVTMSTGSTTAVLYIGFTSNELASSQITDYLERVVNPQLYGSQWCIKYRSVWRYEIRAPGMARSSQNGGTKPLRSGCDEHSECQQLSVSDRSGDW